MKKRTSIIFIIIVIVVVFALREDSPSDTSSDRNESESHDSDQSSDTLVGGPCAYDSYEGTCTIETVEPYEDDESGYTVEYSFAFPFDEVPEDLPLWFDDEPGDLHSVNIMPADAGDDAESCMEFGDIEEGNDVDCELKIITDGTCTPEIVQLTGIDDSCRQTPL